MKARIMPGELLNSYKVIYNEKLKNRIVSENRDLGWRPLSFYTHMFWAHLSSIHTWPKGYWLKHFNKIFASVQFILEGEMTVLMEQKEYVIKAGEAVIIPPGTCKLSTNGKNGCKKFYFIPDGQIFYSIMRQIRFDQIAILSGKQTGELIALYKQTSNLMEQKDVETIPEISTMIYNLVMKVSEKIQHSNCPEKLSICLDYIQKHIADPLSLELLTKEIHCSKTALKELFAKHLQTSPGRYICDTRLNYAKMLLAKHDLSIKDIAFMCGYENPLYFSNAFKHKFGESPRRFRQSRSVMNH